MGAGSEHNLHPKPVSLNHYTTWPLTATPHSRGLKSSFEQVAWGLPRGDRIQQTHLFQLAWWAILVSI